MTDDLITWLRWVLDQREAEARLLCALAGVTDTGTWLRNLLAEVDAKRRILDEHMSAEAWPNNIRRCITCRAGDIGNQAWPCPTVRLLAIPHADRPGYREDWRP